jgi:hypothetical protein
MAAANRNLEEEFDALKAGVDTLRKELSWLVGSVGDAVPDEVRTRGRRTRAAVGRAADRVGEVWGGFTFQVRHRVEGRRLPRGSGRRGICAAWC